LSRRRRRCGDAQAAEANADPSDLTAREARKLCMWCIDPDPERRADARVGMEVRGTCSCPPTALVGDSVGEEVEDGGLVGEGGPLRHEE
jgi:hypothetical protein